MSEVVKKVRSVTIPLEFEVEHEGVTIKEVTIRRPTAGDLEVIDESLENLSRMRQATLMVSTLGDIPHEAARKIDADDIAAIMEKIESFFPQAKA